MDQEARSFMRQQQVQTVYLDAVTRIQGTGRGHEVNRLCSAEPTHSGHLGEVVLHCWDLRCWGPNPQVLQGVREGGGQREYGAAFVPRC